MRLHPYCWLLRMKQPTNSTNLSQQTWPTNSSAGPNPTHISIARSISLSTTTFTHPACRQPVQSYQQVNTVKKALRQLDGDRANAAALLLLGSAGWLLPINTGTGAILENSTDFVPVSADFPPPLYVRCSEGTTVYSRRFRKKMLIRSVSLSLVKFLKNGYTLSSKHHFMHDRTSSEKQACTNR